MSGPPIKRRRTKAIGPDSIEMAKAFTHKTFTTTDRSGVEVTKDVLVPLVPDKPNPDNAASSTSNLPYNDITMMQEYDETMYHNDDGFNSHNKTKVCL